MEDRVVPPGAPDPETLPRSWEELFPRRPKPEDAPYGFVSVNGTPLSASREQLLHMAGTRAIPSLVWTPETAEMVPPWEVDFLLDVMRGQVANAARRERWMVAGGWAALVAVVALFSPVGAVVVAVVAGLLALIVVGMITRRMGKARTIPAEQFRRELDAAVAQQVEKVMPAPATRRVAMALIMVGVCQLLFKDASIEAGAVSREAVAVGEWWRLLTAPMLHGGILHFWMNYGALESLGRTMETRGVRSYVPLVFLAAALAGGACSILLPPESRSVGASGGLMGMFGFLGVMAWRRKNHLPEGFLRTLMINVAIIALMGVVAYRFIDNAAHGGGLLAGVLIGLTAIPRGEAAWVETPALLRAGWLAQWVIFGFAMLAIGLTLRIGLA
jgi:membrane associated rhomboid family serine protease